MKGMPYGLVAGPDPRRLTAGLSNGEVWESADAGESWVAMTRLPAVERSFIRIDA